MGPDGGSILWINPCGIAAGSADCRTASLLVNTSAVVEFSDGQADRFSAVTGLFGIVPFATTVIINVTGKLPETLDAAPGRNGGATPAGDPSEAGAEGCSACALW
ncbi:MAG: hypothetical protein QOE90_3487 [Thermoplasmata archaeon]|jgi:hypothetical protein|nr:hypothetical protein [Thermoplasmata archaeon]